MRTQYRVDAGQHRHHIEPAQNIRLDHSIIEGMVSPLEESTRSLRQESFVARNIHVGVLDAEQTHDTSTTKRTRYQYSHAKFELFQNFGEYMHK